MRMQNIVNVILGTAFSAGASMAAIAAQPAASAGDRSLSSILQSIEKEGMADSSWKCNALATVLSCSWLRPESTPEQRFEVVFASPVSCAGEC